MTVVKSHKHYKVVIATADLGFCSAGVPKELIHVYPVGEWVEFEIGGGLVFDSVKHAVAAFPALTKAAGETALRLFACVVDEEASLPEYRCSWAFYSHPLKDYVARVWSGIGKGDFPWPEGTKAFKRIKLVKRIEIYESLP